MEHKAVPLQIRKLEDSGEFVGLASTYGNVDLGGDVIERGAFTKTISERGDEVVILDHHDSRRSIGLGRVEDSDEGLIVRGKLELDLPEASSAHKRLKARLMKGLSIGYRVPRGKIRFEDGVRYLKEVILDEISLVTFPMNPRAQLLSVKDASALIAEAEATRKQLDDAIEAAKQIIASAALQGDGGAANSTPADDGAANQTSEEPIFYHSMLAQFTQEFSQ